MYQRKLYKQLQKQYSYVNHTENAMSLTYRGKKYSRPSSSSKEVKILKRVHGLHNVDLSYRGVDYHLEDATKEKVSQDLKKNYTFPTKGGVFLCTIFNVLFR